MKGKIRHKLKYKKYTEDQLKIFIDKFGDDEDFWMIISAMQELSEEFMREYADKIYWDNATTSQKMSEQFMIEYADKLNWDHLCRFGRNLSEQFIDQYADKVNWYYLFKYKKVNEKLITKYAYKFDENMWETIFQTQILSEEFLWKHKSIWWNKNEYINMIRSYQNISHEFNRKLIRRGQVNLEKLIKEKEEKYYREKRERKRREKEEKAK